MTVPSTPSDDKTSARVTKIPSSLLKASVHPSDTAEYILGLRSGMLIWFTGCSLYGDWVHLDRPIIVCTTTPFPGGEAALPKTIKRGMDVQIDEIAWCADDPEGWNS